MTTHPFYFMLHQAGGATAVVRVNAASGDRPEITVVHSFKPEGVVSCAKDAEETRCSAVTVGTQETEVRAARSYSSGAAYSVCVFVCVWSLRVF